MILFTRHAAQRYVDRVKPAFNIQQAARELERLLPECQIEEAWPVWTHRAGFSNVNAEAVAVLPDVGVCFPVVRKGDDWLAITVLTNGGQNPERREAKNARRAERRASRRFAANKQVQRKLEKHRRQADGLR